MRLDQIQAALREQGLDGWLFYDHHRRDPLAYRTLGLPDGTVVTRRWYYFIPAHGEPRGLVHRIEPHSLDAAPGEKLKYSRWTEQVEQLRRLIAGARVVAMQHSPNCAVPYVALVDAGTIELVRSLGVEVRSSADLIQLFEARWSAAQLDSHLEAGRRVDKIRHEAFALITARLKAGSPVTEFEVKESILTSFRAADLMTDHGPIVAVNANASDPHYEPNVEKHSPIREGDLVLIDMWAKLVHPDAVYYDITWVAYCGQSAPDEMTRVFEVVSGARDAGVRLVEQRMGSGAELHGFEVDDAARGHIAAQGFAEYFIHRTGHSIGTEVHGAGANMDNFETHDDRRVIPCTCFSIEPGVYLPHFGIRSEVNVYCGERDARVTGEKQERLLTLIS